MDLVTNELPARPLNEIYQLYLGMIVPFVVEIRNQVVPDAKAMLMVLGYLQ